MPSQEKTSASTFWDGKLSEYAHIVVFPVGNLNPEFREQLQKAQKALITAGVQAQMSMETPLTIININPQTGDIRLGDSPDLETLNAQRDRIQKETLLQFQIALLEEPELQNKRLIVSGDFGDDADFIQSLTQTYRVAVLGDLTLDAPHNKNGILNAIKAGACVTNQQFALNQLNRMRHEL